MFFFFPQSSYFLQNQWRHHGFFLPLLDGYALRHLLTATINYRDTWIWDLSFPQLHTGKPTEDLLSATKGNKLSRECHPVPCRTFSAHPRSGQPGSFSRCLRDNVSWHLLLGIHLLLFGDNFSVFMSQLGTPAKGKQQCRTHKTYPVLAQLELAALCWGKRGDGSRQQWHCKCIYIYSIKVVSQALIPLRYPRS